MEMNRNKIAELILQKLEANKESLKQQYDTSSDKIGAFFLDDVLPNDVAQLIYSKFPAPEQMTHKKTLRESKYIAAQMDKYDPLLEEALFAFQDPRVVKVVGEICSIKKLVPDEHLYAGGISLMTQEGYLNPHIDNSHDKDRDRWRVLNILYYVNPDWEHDFGGNLEIWPGGMKQPQTTFVSKFNRLVVMATHNKSWHSVSPIKVSRNRCCVSNYYFSNEPLKQTDSFHVTTFRGRPEQPVADVILQGDGMLRTMIRKLFPKGIGKLSHFYKR
ncbi:2OG-Fe(II) oxygenase [Bdellovibrio sp. HCB274]|uniref:2OG-Fe(II) oxygenase n=1 Tax=Bdellovibrio sp. HCB274 TaxID=3394361 RepID=UPI0039B663B5